MIRDIPKGLRGGRAFQSERHLLRWVIQRLQDPSRRDLHFETLSEEQDGLLEASLGLMRAETAYAKGVYLLSGSEDPDAAIPIVRSLFELWADIKYLFEPGDHLDRVTRMRIWGTLVLLGHAIAGKHVRGAAAELRQKHPMLYAELERQHKARPTGHYSGKGRKRLISEMCGANYGGYYEFLSWDTHPITQGIADVGATEDGLRRRFAYRRSKESVAVDVCVPAIVILTDSWSLFVRHFGHLGSPQHGSRRRRAEKGQLTSRAALSNPRMQPTGRSGAKLRPGGTLRWGL